MRVACARPAQELRRQACGVHDRQVADAAVICESRGIPMFISALRLVSGTAMRRLNGTTWWEAERQVLAKAGNMLPFSVSVALPVL